MKRSLYYYTTSCSLREVFKVRSPDFQSLLQKSWHGHLAREKRLFSWQIPAMNHKDTKTQKESPSLCLCVLVVKSFFRLP